MMKSTRVIFVEAFQMNTVEIKDSGALLCHDQSRIMIKNTIHFCVRQLTRKTRFGYFITKNAVDFCGFIVILHLGIVLLYNLSRKCALKKIIIIAFKNVAIIAKIVKLFEKCFKLSCNVANYSCEFEKRFCKFCKFYVRKYAGVNGEVTMYENETPCGHNKSVYLALL